MKKVKFLTFYPFAPLLKNPSAIFSDKKLEERGNWNDPIKIYHSESESESHSVVSISLRPHGLYSPWDSPGQNTGVGSPSLLQGNLPNPRIKSRSPTLQADSLPTEPQGKPKNTGVGSLSLLQWIFPTQESNRGPLHCRQILYQLSNQGSPSRASSS